MEQPTSVARVGATGFDYTKSKSTTLVYAPVIGLLIVSATVAVMDSGAPEAIAAVARHHGHLLGGALVDGVAGRPLEREVKA